MHQITDAEGVVNVTMLPFVNAAGKLFSGVFVFPCKKIEGRNEEYARRFHFIGATFGLDDTGELFECP